MTERILFALVLCLLASSSEAGRRRVEPLPPIKTVYFQGDNQPDIHLIRVQYLLGPGFWVSTPFVLEEGDCLRTYQDVGLRLRGCWEEYPEIPCSDQTITSTTIPVCGRTYYYQ